MNKDRIIAVQVEVYCKSILLIWTQIKNVVSENIFIRGI